MSIDDERVRFYFRNRVQIEEWANLRFEAAAAVDEWLEQLEPDLIELARSLGADVRLSTRIEKDQAYPLFRLRHVSWAANDENDELPCVGLEWVRNQTTMRKNYMPYVGLRSPKAHETGTALRNSEALKQARAARKDLAWTNSAYWPAYRYLAPPTDFPASADGYRETLLEAVRNTWTTFAPLVTNVLAASTSNVTARETQPYPVTT